MAYVYRHIRLDKNEPFYIGIGSDLDYKRANWLYGRNKIWNRITKKSQYDVEILIDNISYDDAKQKEIEFILLYGRKNNKTGTLANLTDGGDGATGAVFSEEHIQKLKLAKIGKKLTESHIDILKITNKGNKYSLGKYHTKETKKRMSEVKLGNVYNMKTVLNKETGIYYNCVREAAESRLMKIGTLTNMLNGFRKNNTSFIYV